MNNFLSFVFLKICACITHYKHHVLVDVQDMRCVFTVFRSNISFLFYTFSARKTSLSPPSGSRSCCGFLTQSWGPKFSACGWTLAVHWDPFSSYRTWWSVDKLLTWWLSQLKQFCEVLRSWVQAWSQNHKGRTSIWWRRFHCLKFWVQILALFCGQQKWNAQRKWFI